MINEDMRFRKENWKVQRLKSETAKTNDWTFIEELDI